MSDDSRTKFLSVSSKSRRTTLTLIHRSVRSRQRDPEWLGYHFTIREGLFEEHMMTSQGTSL